MTPETLQRMREAAEGACKGPWKLDEQLCSVLCYGVDDPTCDEVVAEAGRWGWSHEQTKANAAHIALASPENVLALLDEVERLRDLVCQIEDLSERWTNSVNPVTECRGEELREALS